MSWKSKKTKLIEIVFQSYTEKNQNDSLSRLKVLLLNSSIVVVGVVLGYYY